MCIPRRLIIIATSVVLLLVVALSLATALEVRAPQPRQKLIHIAVAQKLEQKIEQPDVNLEKGINGSDFDRASIYLPPTLYLTSDPTPVSEPTLLPTSDPKPTDIDQDDGLIGDTKTVLPTQTSDEGYIGPIETSAPPSPPRPSPLPPAAPQLPILALTYSGSSGPKHCRGSIIQKLSLPPPASKYTNGTCISLPSMARCGVFFAGKEAGCEADLFSSDGCVNTTATYINTVVFMPEERTVGAYWKSMRIRCGVKGPEAQVLDPALFGGLVKPKDGKGGRDSHTSGEG